ncbi:hypothetical protein ACFORO_42460 [Amycolatopsis halotolerans]|uniref:DUF732 domain-containing protein n=1 Tax=Amycolatopsis halotolerans TaxID=330083 RepID=A0ABV7QWS6_9PSEU
MERVRVRALAGLAAGAVMFGGTAVMVVATLIAAPGKPATVEAVATGRDYQGYAEANELLRPGFGEYSAAIVNSAGFADEMCASIKGTDNPIGAARGLMAGYHVAYDRLSEAELSGIVGNAKAFVCYR